AVREGLPYEQAVRAITLTPAEICGIDDRVGSITPGKDADLVVFGDDPLTVTAKPSVVFCGGRRVF
ncbi:MAG: amidohydrolase family protein, partial [Oscillospiraceae bacterium]|nr:amidohydrolase family protein [Oscillospiraceae bacterium]